MAKIIRNAVLAAAGLLALIGASCGNSGSSAGVLTGNMAYGRGQYQRAILHYLDAEDGVDAGLDVIHYDLANVYFALGEGDAALRSWSLAESETDDQDLLFRIAFNRGVLYYHRGRYDEAYRSFRRALEVRPSDIDAKVNLEESLLRVRSAVPQSSPVPEAVEDTVEEDESRLLDYIKRKEAEAWSTEESAAEAGVEDW